MNAQLLSRALAFGLAVGVVLTVLFVSALWVSGWLGSISTTVSSRNVVMIVSGMFFGVLAFQVIRWLAARSIRNAK